MRSPIWLLAVVFVASASAQAGAQTGPSLSPLEIAIACAPPPALDVSPSPLHVVGTQSPSSRALYGGSDLLIIDGGTKAGVAVGQQFYVRRENRFGVGVGSRGRGAKTLGWVRIVASNESTSIAQVDHMCGELLRDDYLEPYTAPIVPVDIERVDTTGEPDFNALGRVVVGADGRGSVATGDFALIDRGAEQGVTPGQRFAVYRDLGVNGLPLVSVGEAIVISTTKSVALARITRVRDAIIPGDYVAARK